MFFIVLFTVMSYGSLQENKRHPNIQHKVIQGMDDRSARHVLATKWDLKDSWTEIQDILDQLFEQKQFYTF